MQTLDNEMDVKVGDETITALVEATDVEGDDPSVGIFGRLVTDVKIMIWDGAENHEISRAAYEKISEEEYDRVCSVLTGMLQERDMEGPDYEP